MRPQSDPRIASFCMYGAKVHVSTHSPESANFILEKHEKCRIFHLFFFGFAAEKCGNLFIIVGGVWG